MGPKARSYLFTLSGGEIDDSINGHYFEDMLF